ncbi:MAG: Hsp20/alpha crystallin family protein [Hyphomicrobiales bacterium]|nr:Hsp20/alpha crystallin family protein [Hyphomicrobiales bacterium]MCP5373601.1 Hsp20/alpha crystallin family protein [Hyphomicrobiales bacterium]
MSVIVKKEDVKATPEKTAEKAMSPVERPLTHPLQSLRTEIDRLFDDFFPGFHRGDLWRGFNLDPFDLFKREPVQFRALTPKVDVEETAKAFTITAEMPGLDEGDIDVTLADGMLTVKGEKKFERDETKKDFHLMERSYGSFRRSFRVPEAVDDGKVTATFDKGVLTLTLPKTAKARKNVKKVRVTKTP